MNYNKFANQMKELVIDFGIKLSDNLHKPMRKFVIEMIFGITASKSILLSNIARSLDETISIKETDDRLSENLDRISDKLPTIWQNYRQNIKQYINEDTLFNIDDTDIIKPLGKHFEASCKVIDGSSKDKKLVNGYPVTEIVAITKNNSHPVSVYSNVYSTITPDFKSVNVETDEALDSIYASFGNVGTVVMDRGYDDSKRMNYFLNKDWNFIIRGKFNRNVIYQGKESNVLDFAYEYKGKISIKVHLKRKAVTRKCSYFKVRLRGVKKPVYLVIVYFKGEAAIFYTNREINCKKDVIKVVSDYFKRWRVEEYFKFKKQEYGFENFRVRSLKKINALNVLLSMAINMVGTQTEIESNLSYILMELSKPIKTQVYFNYYRISAGVKELFKYLRDKLYNLLRKSRQKEKQLSLFLDIFDIQ